MFSRLLKYFQVMFPPVYLFNTILGGAVFFIFFSRFYDVSISVNSLLIRAVISFLLFQIMLRVMDELKDYEDDLINFPDRPVPAGLVKLSDLRLLLVTAFIVVALLNLSDPRIFAASLFVMLFSWLMFKWFFIESIMRKSLPLAFLTHHPIVYIQYFYLFVVLTTMAHLSMSSYWLVIPIACIATTWEFSRKLFSPKDETQYRSYSMVLGPRVAGVLALVPQTATIIGITYYLITLSAPTWFTALFLIAFLGLMTPYVVYVFTLKTSSKYALKKLSETEGGLVIFTILSEFFGRSLSLF